jgi:hypothetical protein
MMVKKKFFSKIIKEQKKKKAIEMGEEENVTAKPVVPLKKELENASNTFEKYKSKISNFFVNTKKLEHLTNEMSKKTSANSELTGLNKLMLDYSDEEEDAEKEEDADVVIDEKQSSAPPSQSLIVPKVAEIVNDKEDDDDDDDDDQDDFLTDLGQNCDLEIVTTSEVRANLYNHARNYVLPSLKASYFPLKASLDYSSVGLGTSGIGGGGGGDSQASFIAMEKSKSALTLMGRAGSVLSDSKQRRVKLTDILFGTSLGR